MRGALLQRILYLFVGLSVIGVSPVGAQSTEQSSEPSFMLRQRSGPVIPRDYALGALHSVNPAVRRVIRTSLSDLYSGDMDAFATLVTPESQHRLRERFQDLVESLEHETNSFDSVRIAPLQDRGSTQQLSDRSADAVRGYALRVIDRRYVTSGQVWVVVGASGPIIDDIVLDFRNRESFGDESRKFAPGGARTVW